MALNASKVNSSGGTDIEPLEPGNYPARLVQVIDLGVQPQRPYQGQEKPPAQEINLVYELVSEYMKDEDGNDDTDKPRWVFETIPFYNLNSDRAKSTLRYKALDPSIEFGGDFTALVGKPCLVNIVNNVNKKSGKTYNNVAAISAPIKGMDIPGLKHEPVVFDLDNPDMTVFNGLPEYIRGKITDNLNFRGSALEQALSGNAQGSEESFSDMDEDIPV